MAKNKSNTNKYTKKEVREMMLGDYMSMKFPRLRDYQIAKKLGLQKQYYSQIKRGYIPPTWRIQEMADKSKLPWIELRSVIELNSSKVQGGLN
jgi:transcriptional regulator with XRE-family HTH domain